MSQDEKRTTIPLSQLVRTERQPTSFPEFGQMTPETVGRLLTNYGWQQWLHSEGKQTIWVPKQNAAEPEPSMSVLLLYNHEDPRYVPCLNNAILALSRQQGVAMDELMRSVL